MTPAASDIDLARARARAALLARDLEHAAAVGESRRLLEQLRSMPSGAERNRLESEWHRADARIVPAYHALMLARCAVLYLESPAARASPDVTGVFW